MDKSDELKLADFHYSIVGENTQNRIVFVHGLMAFAANWRKIASRLQNDFQCLIYDQRGHGRSIKPSSGYSPEHFASDLKLITDELGWSNFHLVGHSMGGRNVMVFANLFPEKVLTLTIEDMGPEAEPDKSLYYEKMLNSVPTPFATKEQLKLFFDQQFFQNFTAQEPNAVLSTFLQANIEQKESGLYDWKFEKSAILEIVQEGHRKDRWLEVSNFKMPVLLIRGEKSHILKQETFEKMLNVNPNIHGLEIAGAGHWVHFEKYLEFEKVLREFLQNNA